MQPTSRTAAKHSHVEKQSSTKRRQNWATGEVERRRQRAEEERARATKLLSLPDQKDHCSTPPPPLQQQYGSGDRP